MAGRAGGRAWWALHQVALTTGLSTHLPCVDACEQAQAHKDQPTIIIASTVKGKGVSFMSEAYEWHAKVPTPEELEQALGELGQSENRIDNGR